MMIKTKMKMMMESAWRMTLKRMTKKHSAIKRRKSSNKKVRNLDRFKRKMIVLTLIETILLRMT